MTEVCKIRQLVDLMQRFRHKGLIWGKELLLPPREALHLVDELVAQGVAIWGIDTYYRWDPDNKQRLAEDVGRDLSVPDDIMASSDAVQRSASMARDFLEHRLPERTAYVTVFPGDPYNSIDFFPDEPTPNYPH